MYKGVIRVVRIESYTEKRVVYKRVIRMQRIESYTEKRVVYKGVNESCTIFVQVIWTTI